jgi:hypothetical protein
MTYFGEGRYNMTGPKADSRIALGHDRDARASIVVQKTRAQLELAGNVKDCQGAQTGKRAKTDVYPACRRGDRFAPNLRG